MVIKSSSSWMPRANQTGGAVGRTSADRHAVAKQKTPHRIEIRVGVDTGGTFTDFVFASQGGLEVFKLPSTPADPSLAILAGLERIAEITGRHINQLEVVHGTTVGTNALLQR